MTASLYEASPVKRARATKLHERFGGRGWWSEVSPTHPIGTRNFTGVRLGRVRARFRARSRIARCEVRYNREKVLLVESGNSLDHQRAPYSRSSAVPDVIELPEHVAR
jgi:hypothetical protein